MTDLKVLHISRTPEKNYRISEQKRLSIMFFYLAVNKLITGKTQNCDNTRGALAA